MADRRFYAGNRRKESSRVVMNRAALTALAQGIADGYGQFGQTVLDVARPMVPDAPPYGLGLVNSGGWVVFANGRKVGGTANVRLGRRDQNRPPRQGIALFVGYAFPGRFAERGTVRTRAQPFLSPALFETLPRLPALVRDATAARLGRVR